MANEVFLTILLSLVFALGLDPLVGWFTGRGMGRGKAALLVFFLLFLAVFVIVVWAVTPVWNEIRALVQDIPGYIDDLKDEPAFQQLADNTDAVDKAQEVATNAAKAIPEAASALLGHHRLAGRIRVQHRDAHVPDAVPADRAARLQARGAQHAAAAEAERVGRVLDEVTRTISFSLLGTSRSP